MENLVKSKNGKNKVKKQAKTVIANDNALDESKTEAVENQSKLKAEKVVKKPKNTMSTIEIIESQLKKEKKETKQYEKSTQVKINKLTRVVIRLYE